MGVDDRTGDGVGALNARSEVLLFTRSLAAAPQHFQCRAPDRIRLVADGRVVHAARYPELVYGAASGHSPVMVGEIGEGGGVLRMSRITRMGRVA